jgi:hypothetical protein
VTVPATEEGPYHIRLERRTGSAEPVVMWLTSSAPVRWGERDGALKFESKAEARRAAASIKLAGDWFIEPVVHRASMTVDLTPEERTTFARLGRRLTQSQPLPPADEGELSEPLSWARGCRRMRELGYYRDQSARARRLANSISHPEARSALLQMARDYEELAADLEKGAIEIRHAELMPQRGRKDAAD